MKVWLVPPYNVYRLIAGRIERLANAQSLTRICPIVLRACVWEHTNADSQGVVHKGYPHFTPTTATVPLDRAPPPLPRSQVAPS